MNEIYRAMNISKQAFHQNKNKSSINDLKYKGALVKVHQIRNNNPGMSVRHIYFKIKPEGIGRDLFESFCNKHGLKLKMKKNFTRTTNSNGVIRIDNILEHTELTRVNQAYVSDLTYYQIGGRTYYLTLIMDIYSRYIVGYAASERMFTEQTTLPSIRMAFKTRGAKNLKNTIIHSDGGGQYYSSDFLSQTSTMINSMGKSVYENIHAERLNGTIKNQYLRYYKPKDFEELTYYTKKAVKMYNTEKPHSALDGLSPAEFERLSSSEQMNIKRKIELKREKKKKKNSNLAFT